QVCPSLPLFLSPLRARALSTSPLTTSASASVTRAEQPDCVSTIATAKCVKLPASMRQSGCPIATAEAQFVVWPSDFLQPVRARSTESLQELSESVPRMTFAAWHLAASEWAS